MSQRNGYFRLLYLEDGTYLEIFAPADGGNPVSFDELTEYLLGQDFLVDIVSVANAIETCEGDKCLVKIAEPRSTTTREAYSLHVSEDKMRLVARFYPCSNAAASLILEDVINDLHGKKIIYGIKDMVISEYFSNRQYCTDYLIAEGTPVNPGKDGYIEYKFNTDHNMKPKMNADGTVDFFNLNLISPCKKGQVLAILVPPIPGEVGRDIYGGRIELSREPFKPQFKYGKGISVSEDGKSLISNTDGNVTLVDDTVFVSDVYEVSDVDASTGNIDYNGDVRVLGNVKSGFCVQASGSIEIRGFVESAMVQADRDVIINRGMNGMGKGIILAGNNVVSKFIENSRVQAGGYVQTEALLHCDVSAKGDVTVNGKKGFIAGGSVKAQGNVDAKIIGSSMGVDTEIEVGSDPSIKLKLNNLKQSLDEQNQKLEQVKPVLATLTMRLKKGDKLTESQLQSFKQLTVEYKELMENIQYLTEEQDGYLASANVSDAGSYVRVSECAYPGTKITVGEVSNQLKSAVSHSRFVKEGADIRVKAY